MPVQMISTVDVQTRLRHESKRHSTTDSSSFTWWVPPYRSPVRCSTQGILSSLRRPSRRWHSERTDERQDNSWRGMDFTRRNTPSTSYRSTGSRQRRTARGLHATSDCKKQCRWRVYSTSPLYTCDWTIFIPTRQRTILLSQPVQELLLLVGTLLTGCIWAFPFWILEGLWGPKEVFAKWCPEMGSMFSGNSERRIAPRPHVSDVSKLLRLILRDPRH